ncbi:transposase [Kitasatospora aureofaciens]|uniref:zinc ribbon domain-containing protein n=1 Tax=Kitasatospora aureofaciens TaxID=1894 RepID=UPI001C456D4D|nr:zinc ribbon domain-containing protein [Kitasatospora aureofaciens]MBV6701225.1 transposase [Kitasatospora aureofaciens]
MTTPQEAGDAGHARYTYRLRVSSTALAALEGEWSRCRWVWNECVARSRKAHREKAPDGCGPARLDRMLTEARAAMGWLREGSSVSQQQIIRDFAKSRAKTLKDIKARLPVRQRAGMPKKKRAKACKKVARQREDTARKWAKQVVRNHDALAVEDFRPKFLAKFTMAKKAADAAIGATKRALIEMGRKHGRAVHLVHPAHTTMDCAHCHARAKHALPLGMRVYTCTACGVSSPRDKNSAHVMLVRAGLSPADVESRGPAGTPSRKAA